MCNLSILKNWICHLLRILSGAFCTYPGARNHIAAVIPSWPLPKKKKCSLTGKSPSYFHQWQCFSIFTCTSSSFLNPTILSFKFFNKWWEIKVFTVVTSLKTLAMTQQLWLCTNILFVKIHPFLYFQLIVYIETQTLVKYLIVLIMAGRKWNVY